MGGWVVVVGGAMGVGTWVPWAWVGTVETVTGWVSLVLSILLYML